MFKKKEIEDVFGGPGAWDNAQKGAAQCPKEGCDGEEAAFFQVQIRSADEPMTTFYKVRYIFALLFGTELWFDMIKCFTYAWLSECPPYGSRIL